MALKFREQKQYSLNDNPCVILYNEKLWLKHFSNYLLSCGSLNEIGPMISLIGMVLLSVTLLECMTLLEKECHFVEDL